MLYPSKAPMLSLSKHEVHPSSRACRGTKHARRLLGLCLAAALGLCSAIANAQDAELPDIRIEPLHNTQPNLTVEVIEDLHFGKVVPGPGGGSVVIRAADGSKLTTGGAVDLGGFHSRAEYKVRGKPGAHFVIFLPDERPMRGPNGRAKLTDFESVPPHMGQLNGHGFAKIEVGAAVQMHHDQPPGRYRGRFDVGADKL